MLAVACGGVPMPVDQLAASQAAIRGAEEAGAVKEPQAALHLKLAREQVDKAKLLIEDDDNEEANLLLLRAEADAELARALAHKQATQTDAAEAVKDLKKVKK